MHTMAKEIFISCGDPSGDMHASNLAKWIKKLSPGIKITSMGGSRTESASDNFLCNLVDMQLHGIWEPAKHYFGLKKLLSEKIIPYLKQNRPSAIIPVDFYGFNIRLSGYARSMGIPVYYYVSPQVWATRPGRLRHLKKNIDHMFVIFPFEEKIYRDAGIPVSFTGHPLIDLVPHPNDYRQDTAALNVGVFPGSRKQVIRWNLPTMQGAVDILKDRFPQAKFYIFGFREFEELYKGVRSAEIIYGSPDGKNYAGREQLSLAISTSGTVTLENALMGIPMIVTYKLPWPTYFLIKSLIRVSTITIVNLIMNENIVPEYIQRNAMPGLIANVATAWLKDPPALDKIREKFKSLRSRLGEEGVYERTARSILEKIHE